MAMKRCLITGATGLVGSHLMQMLLPEWEVFAVSRRRPNGLAKEVHHLPIDLSKEWSVADLPQTVDAVVHLAQSEHFRDFPEAAEDVFRVNTFSTLKLLDYARRAGAQSFILASSGGIYGYGDQEFSEDTEISSRGDLGFYLGTKLCSEVVAEAYARYMNIIALRLFFVYGPGQKPGMLIPRLVQSIQEEKSIQLQGMDGIRINPTYVTDAAQAIVKATTLQKSYKINIGGPQVLSLRQIGEIIGSVTGKSVRFETDTTAKPKHLVGDIKKMSELLIAPAINFENGIHKYIQSICQEVPV
jgi:UDP-glucose 4-epimerase